MSEGRAREKRKVRGKLPTTNDIQTDNSGAEGSKP
jgi:hypothetical protein